MCKKKSITCHTLRTPTNANRNTHIRVYTDKYTRTHSMTIITDILADKKNARWRIRTHWCTSDLLIRTCKRTHLWFSSARPICLIYIQSFHNVLSFKKKSVSIHQIKPVMTAKYPKNNKMALGKNWVYAHIL